MVKECNEKELLEVLWKRGKDNLNIALRMQVVKLYRMLNGERLHKERPTKQKNSRENFSQKNKGKFRRDDFPSRYPKDVDNDTYTNRFQNDNEHKFSHKESRFNNEENQTNGERWNRKRPPYRGRTFDSVVKNQ